MSEQQATLCNPQDCANFLNKLCLNMDYNLCPDNPRPDRVCPRCITCKHFPGCQKREKCKAMIRSRKYCYFEWNGDRVKGLNER